MFTKELFAFLDELRDNNSREWFDANRDRYEQHVREPALDFITAFAPRLEQISPRFEADARRSGGSLFRINRDTRFAKDKSPYRTNAGIIFHHERRRTATTPGFYLHLEPGSVFMACGVWHPERDTLHAIRTAIAAKPKRWTEIVDGLDGFRLGGESLKRPPAGFDRDHPLIEELKRKDFMAIADLSEADALDGDFLDEFLALCGRAATFMRFLCDSTRVSY